MSVTVSDTNCVSLYRLVDVPQRCNTGYATMSFATLSTAGTLIANQRAPLDP